MSLISKKYKNKEVCKYCKFAETDQIDDRICMNNKSKKRADFVDDFDSCEYFEKDE